MLWVTPEEKAELAKGRAPIHGVNPVTGFNLGIEAEESRYDMARMEPPAADSLVGRYLVDQLRL